MAQEYQLDNSQGESPAPTHPRKDICPTFSDDPAWPEKPVQLSWWQQELKDLEEAETKTPDTTSLVTLTPETSTPEAAEITETVTPEADEIAETQQTVTIEKVNTKEYTRTETVRVSTTDVNVAAAGTMLLLLGIAIGRISV